MDDALPISWLRPSTANNFWLFESKTLLIFYVLGETDLTICSAGLPGPVVNNDNNNNDGNFFLGSIEYIKFSFHTHGFC